ncbi:MAG: sulfite exporter TauE/SafE family protein [Deltaproteobacteria bacterium]|nr:sulfite exporter TauE/SafE family protein [Deltaproteobacteria bacterium]
MEQLVILSIIFLAVSGFFSMVGLGGGILYVPILLFAGYSLNHAPGISLMLIAATSAAASITFWRNDKVDWRLALVIDPPTDVMAFVGGYFSAQVPKGVLRILLASILILAGWLMFRKKGRGVIKPSGSRWWVWHRRFGDETYQVNLPLVLIASGSIGLLSGLLGIAGGVVKLPIMVLLCGVPMDVAVATSTVMIGVTALSGLVGHQIQGNVLWNVGFILSGVAVVGGLIGSRISLSVDKARLKRIFALVLWFVAARFLVQTFFGW